MQYMLLIYAGENAAAKPDVEQFQSTMAAHRSLMDDTRKRGILLGTNPLRASATAKTIRKGSDGKTFITDGPFTETKEQLAGYYLLECKDIDEALAYAQRIPIRCAAGTVGGVEVREVLPFSEIQQQLESLLAEQHA